MLCGAGGGAHTVAQKLHKELVAGLALSRFDPTTILFQVRLLVLKLTYAYEALQAACLAVTSATPVMYNAGILSTQDCVACVKILQGLAENPKLFKVYNVQ